jgi:hypothetical protein
MARALLEVTIKRADRVELMPRIVTVIFISYRSQAENQ